MLVLGRKCGEKIVIPQLGITITIERVKGDTVRIGVDAPEDILVLREELLQQQKPVAKKLPA